MQINIVTTRKSYSIQLASQEDLLKISGGKGFLETIIDKQGKNEKLALFSVAEKLK